MRHILLIILLVFSFAQQAKAGWGEPRHRYSPDAYAADVGACTVIISAFIASAPFGGVAGFAAYASTKAIAERWKDDSTILNTPDPQAGNYNENYDHTIPGGDHYNQIGIEVGGDELWLNSESCGVVGDYGTQVCAWEEGDEICAEGVFCTGVLVGGLLPIGGEVSDPDLDVDDAQRNCTAADFAGDSATDGAPRCECRGCPDPDKLCKTYNEKYRSHCIKKSPENTDIITPDIPSIISNHCKSGIDSGFSSFNFSGKVMRCISSTLENVFSGQTDVIRLDGSGDPIRDSNNNVIFTKQCLDGSSPANGLCSVGFFVTIRAYFQQTVLIFLALFVSFLAVRLFLNIGGGFGTKDLFTWAIQIGFILYFVLGTAWQDGYYKVLVRSAYELANNFVSEIKVAPTTFDCSSLRGETFTTQEISNTPGCSVDADGVITGTTSSPPTTVIAGSACTVQQQGTLGGTSGSVGARCDFSNVVYPAAEQHFIIWDMLDCRMSEYLFFGKKGPFSELIALAQGSLLSAALGVVIFTASIILMIMLIVMVLKAVYIALSALLALSLLIFVSPLTIPLMLFKKTKPIFDTWFSQIIAYSVQPFVLLTLLVVIFGVLDSIFYEPGGMYDIMQNHKSETKELILGIIIPTIGIGIVDDILYSLLKMTLVSFIFLAIFSKVSDILANLTGEGVLAGMPEVYGKIKGLAKAGGDRLKSVYRNKGSNDDYK
jgi:type IV secretory pathway VirB6-like protein